jgi:hypothetical protein
VIDFMDGGPKRLIGMLRQLEAWYVEKENQDDAQRRVRRVDRPAVAA